MIKNLYLVRHGEAEHLIGKGLTGGWTDSDLTEKGRMQAHETGKRILNFLGKIDVGFYCSDLRRAKDSAEIIGSYIAKKPLAFMELREQNNGDAANLSTEEAQKISSPISEPIMDWIHYPNAESWRSFNNRVYRFMNVIEQESMETVLIVSHRRIILAIIHWWLEFSEDYIKKVSFDIEPCSLTYLRINKWGEKTVSKLNDIAHLTDIKL
ncbi:histidine phosphatase family protein [Desulfosporosinus sp. BG]|uniref:histidine phosphatase family protein n=1 Tax=Desulfosporosinus sp. BG TaxID=1633135 RepID=UPI00083B0748|nr:histidine phosphatase family protein [Desulfosporosinus sp. BG]ODA39871.1 phosphoglycerate mutase family protein [Desulfosporosinus sp. BG]